MQKFVKIGKFEECLVGWRLVDGLVFKNPGEVVWNEYGMEAGREGGVNVRLGAVANHPGGSGFTAMMIGEETICGFILFRQNFNR